MVTRMELLIKLDEENRRPQEKRIITQDEYQHYQQLASFKCPKRFNTITCDGHDCPPKLDDIYEDYYQDCIEHRKAIWIIHEVLTGKTVILNNHNNGWSVPG